MTTSTEVPSRAELVSRAKQLQPVLARFAAHGEADRRQADEVIDALTGAGLFRLYAPRRFGGYAVSVRTLVEVTETLGVADGSSAWVVCIGAGGSWAAALTGDRAQEEVFADTPDVRITANGDPASGRRVDGGLRFSGRWSYASGSPHADWAAVGVAVEGEADAGPAGQYFALVPRRDLVLDENWRTVGMRGTGSHTWVAEDVFVPEHRLLPLSAVLDAEPLLSEPIYRLPVGAFSTVTILGPLLGLATAALAHTVDKAGTKGIHHTVYTRQSESVGVQVQVAEAALKIDTARMHAYRIADELDAATTAGEPVGYADRARLRAAAGYASRQILEAIQMLLDVHGSGSFAEANPLQRFWRDANVMARHAGLNAAVGYEVFGKSLLGVAEQISPVV